MNHNTKPRTHEENRSVLCGICFRKQGELRSISENQLLQIHSLIDSSYNISDIRFQKVLCRMCALALTAHTNNPDKPGRKLMHPKYSNLASPSFHSTRQSESKDCPCTVCDIARNNLTPGSFPGKLPQEKFWNILFPGVPYPAPELKFKPKSSVEPRCAQCHAVVGKGRTHKCTKVNMQDNLHKLVKQKSLKSKEKIGGKVLKNIFQEKVVSTRGGTVSLSTGGNKLPVTLSLKLNKPRFSHENLRRLQVIKGDSDRGIKKFALAVRHLFGRKSVEPGLAESLTTRNKALSEFFEIKSFEMKKKPPKKKKDDCGCDCKCDQNHAEDEEEQDEDGYLTYHVPGVVASSLDSFVREVVDVRQLHHDQVQVLCGLDNGQGFNKIAFLVIQKDKEEVESSRTKRSEELFRDKFKDSGVKKLLLAAVIPACPENHHNQKVMLDALGMDGLEWGTTVDLKMALCLVGKSSGQLTFGCPFCDMAKPYEDTDYNLLTLGDLVQLHEGYVAAGSNKKKQADFQNCVNPNLLAGDPDTPVITMLYPPELHLIIGIVDKHLKGLEAVFGKCWIDNYLKEVHIVRKSYQGAHALEGNQSSMFLKKLPQLEQAIMKESNQLMIEGIPLLESLKCFSKVKEACFGQELHDGYEDCINQFSKVYRSLDNMTITPKVHIVQHHLVDFFQQGNEIVHGLGWYSEQSFEAMHHDMKEEWERLKICDPNHPDFAQRLFDFVVAYNARHM